MDGHSTSRCPECGKIMKGGNHGAYPCEKCMDRLVKEATPPKEKEVTTVKTGLGLNPFEWPDYERNLYQNGAQTSFGGLSAVDMTREELILFIGFLDSQLSSVYFENMNLKGALDGANTEGSGSDTEDSGPRDQTAD